jgi:hypothetical protein
MAIFKKTKTKKTLTFPAGGSFGFHVVVSDITMASEVEKKCQPPCVQL